MGGNSIPQTPWLDLKDKERKVRKMKNTWVRGKKWLRKKKGWEPGTRERKLSLTIFKSQRNDAKPQIITQCLISVLL